MVPLSPITVFICNASWLGRTYAEISARPAACPKPVTTTLFSALGSRPPYKDQADGSPGTLGDLLYARKATPLMSEKEWVELVESIAGGDQGALNALYERTHRLVFTLTMRITQNRETAEELTLDVFHDVWRKAADYHATNGTVLGWVMNQARSRAIDRLRFEQRKKRVDPHPEGPLLANTSSDSLDVLEHRQHSGLLQEAMRSLTSDEREAIEAAFFSGLTYAEVAERLTQPIGTVKTRIRSGLAKLRQALARGGPER